jgi:hypothetical protein
MATAGMRIRFGISTLMLAVGFFCIALGGLTAGFRMVAKRTGAEPAELALLMVVWSPMWSPFAFLLYAAGRRQLNAWIVLAFAAVEAIGLGAMYWATTR